MSATALVASGTQTAVISTEHSLATSVLNRTFRLKLDLAALVNGDVLEVRYKTKVLSGGTARQVAAYHYADVQACPIVYLDPIESDVSLECTLKQTAGTGRDFPWALLSLGEWSRRASLGAWNKMEYERVAPPTKKLYADDGVTVERTWAIASTATGVTETPT